MGKIEVLEITLVFDPKCDGDFNFYVYKMLSWMAKTGEKNGFIISKVENDGIKSLSYPIRGDYTKKMHEKALFAYVEMSLKDNLIDGVWSDTDVQKKSMAMIGELEDGLMEFKPSAGNGDGLLRRLVVRGIYKRKDVQSSLVKFLNTPGDRWQAMATDAIFQAVGDDVYQRWLGDGNIRHRYKVYIACEDGTEEFFAFYETEAEAMAGCDEYNRRFMKKGEPKIIKMGQA